MQCDFCPNEATIEIVIFVNGEAQKVRMCASCYKQKLSEMMENLPQEWGGKQLTDQIRDMLEKAEEAGVLQQGFEVNFINTDGVSGKVSASMEPDATEEDEEGSAVQTFHFNPFRDLQMGMPKEKAEPRETATSAREQAFAQQRKAFIERRNALMQKMQIALDAEEYEKCALYRDELSEIGDALIRLNEERKDPYGV